jgi:dTDP-L-rhamnose 4-epimerase
VKRVLITGGAGFIGQRTAQALVRRGYEVRVLDKLTSPVHPNGRWPRAIAEIAERVEGDVQADSDLLPALRGVQAVLHLAAYQDYLPDFSNFIRTNAASTALLYELIVAHRLPVERIVIASSQAVYGEGAYLCGSHGIQFPDARSIEQLHAGDWDIRCPTCGSPLSWRPTDEAHTNPQNPYGISKLSQELLGISLGRRYGIPTVALRYSITQGAGQSFHNAYSGICRTFSICALQRKPLPVYEDGRQQRDYVYVEDVVAANLLALADTRADYQAYNVGGHEAMSVLEYARLVRDLAGSDLPIHIGGKFRVGDTRHIVSDSSKLIALGWQPTLGVRAIVKEYLEWAGTQPLPANLADAAQARMRRLDVVGTADGPRPVPV